MPDKKPIAVIADLVPAKTLCLREQWAHGTIVINGQTRNYDITKTGGSVRIEIEGEENVVDFSLQELLLATKRMLEGE